MIVKSGELSIPCHTIILVAKSEYFRGMLDGQFKEAKDLSQSRIIELKDDVPEAVEAMIYYIYSFEYVNPEAPQPPMDFHFKVLQTAAKYLLPSLAEKAYMNLADELKRREEDSVGQGNAKGILDLMEFYADYTEHLSGATAEGRRLVREHRSLLFSDRGFRLAFVDDAYGIVEDVRKDTRAAQRAVSQVYWREIATYTIDNWWRW